MSFRPRRQRTDDPNDTEDRVEDRTEEHNGAVQMDQSISDETYNNRTGAERINDPVKGCGLGHVRDRGCVHARAEV